MTDFTACPSCPAPVSCDIRSACDRAQASPEVAALLGEILDLKNRVRQLQDELNKANGSLIASREEARLMRIAADRMAAAHAYGTTKRFHEQQSRGVSIPQAELEVTEEEGEAFAALALRVDRLENAYMTQHGRINTAHDKLDAIKEAL